jgi:mRNA-degrading endonuclease RelE of RelBE toxin-antitoxin system
VTHHVEISRTAGRQLSDRLSESVAAACFEFLSGPLAQNPHQVGSPLHKPFEGQWRARRGEYRVRYWIDEATSTVYVIDVDHRREVYRRV